MFWINQNFSERLPEFHPYKSSGDIQNFDKQIKEIFFFINYIVIAVRPTSKNSLFLVRQKRVFYQISTVPWVCDKFNVYVMLHRFPSKLSTMLWRKQPLKDFCEVFVKAELHFLVNFRDEVLRLSSNKFLNPICTGLFHTHFWPGG